MGKKFFKSNWGKIFRKNSLMRKSRNDWWPLILPMQVMNNSMQMALLTLSLLSVDESLLQKSDNTRLKAFLDLQDSLKEGELSGQVDFTGNIGGLNIGAMANLAGDKNINLGYQTKGGTNLGFTTDLDNNAMFTLNKTFADGGRVPMFMGGAARMGYQALRKYGIEGRDISRLFASLGTDKSLVGKEKTAYFQQLNKVLKNPDDFPDEIMEIQKQLGIDVGIGFRNGGLAGILEV